ncbi:MAG: TonB-dependent receptor [bacterium]|nr:TonB-dependent receptor [bacterium]
MHEARTSALWKATALAPLALAMALAPTPAEEPPAEEPPADEAEVRSEDDDELFERVRIVGTPDDIPKIPGSVTYIGKEQLARQQYFDVNRVLSQVPGVNIQEEDGYGLRPNIGMRGSGSERSSKVTLLEDGVLIAPAPYAAPSAYYFPTPGRMEGFEVRKGSSAIRQGPFTNGGVLNMLSTGIPSEFGGSLNVALGENDTIRGKLNLGGSGERFGWLVETYQYDTAGFKRLDNGGDTGFDLQDYLVKLRVNSRPGARFYQALELKAGKTEQFGEETYLGLTQEDFEATPYRRYAGSQEDTIDTDHEQIQLRYLLRPSDRFDFTATAYDNSFFRNWHKLQSVGGVGIGDVLDNPEEYSSQMDILRADLTADSADDALALRNNRRDYMSRGISAVVGFKPGGTGSTHELELGVRYHEDEEDRFQEEDEYRMTVAGDMQLTALGDPGSKGNRVVSAEAIAVFVQDTIRLGALTVVPGLRFESIDFERVDFDDASRETADRSPPYSVDELIPGVGVTYELDGRNSIFGGVHRGFSPPGAGATDADVEESLNYEVGYRRRVNAFALEVVGFFNDYDNMLGSCTNASGCSGAEAGEAFDGGEVRVYGIEAGVRHDLGATFGSSLSIPLDATYTYTSTEFLNSFDSDYDPWDEVERGDELPYVPQHQGSLSLGVRGVRWSAFANLWHLGEMRTVAGQGPLPELESTDSRLLLDLSVGYRFGRDLRLFAEVRNVTDEAYVAARRPAGARPGIDRTALIGVSLQF